MIHQKANIGYSNLGNSYESGRPSYPIEAVETLILKLKLSENSRILE